MPTSYYGQISTVMNFVQEINPKSILDVGIGFGKYGVLCRENLDIPYERYPKDTWQVRIDGIEGYKGYKNPIHTYVYNKVYYGTIEKTIKKLDTLYDLALMIDVLEHFEKKAGDEIIPQIQSKCRKLLVSVPAVPSQQTYLDNHLETHKSIWQINDFIKHYLLEACSIPMGPNNASIIVLLQGQKD